MRKEQIKFMIEVSIFASLALVFDFLASLYSAVIWPNGGSITLAFIPIFVIGYRHGLKGGLICGLLAGTIQLLWSGYMLNFFQVLLDYVLPNVILGIVGLTANLVKKSSSWKQVLIITVSIVIACFLRFCFLTISGMVYWNTGFVASVLYNGGYTLISMIISIIITPIIVNRISLKD